MKTITVGEFKTNFSSYAEKVERGEEIIVTKGKKKKKIMRILPFSEGRHEKRKLGLLEGKVKIKIHKDWSMNEEELLGL